MFINLSNHPSEIWSEEQIAEAEKYGCVLNMPFPNIRPDASAEEVQQLAQEYANQIAEKAEKELITVHVMGEMTFTYNLVASLKNMGIHCVASTTERKTYIDDSGMKVSEFKFIQFRDY